MIAPVAQTAVLILFAFAIAVAAAPRPASLDTLLEPLRIAGKTPGLAAAVVRGGEIVALGAVGFRKDGSPERVTVNDRWHIGSCTKSMTAVLAAMLIEENKLRWDMTLPEMFPELASALQAEWRSVSLEQLLTHHGGAPKELDTEGLWSRLWMRAGQSPLEQRAYLVREVLTRQKPVAAPGTKYIYSNAGYALIGHAIESKLGQPWETVLRKRLTTPLGMDSVGFGAPATIGQLDQPWGHILSPDGDLKPIPPGLHADNPAAIGPGGTVHCSIGDLAKYAAFQVRGARGKATLLQPATFKKLHTRGAGGGDYACGWAVTDRSWGGGEVLTHNGSNTTFFTVIWLAPQRDFAMVVCANIGLNGGPAVTDQVASALVRKFLSPKSD